MDPIQQTATTRPARALDATDLGIVVALQSHARSSAAELARRGGRSQTSVRQRMGFLSSASVIRSYQTDVALDLVCATVEAIVQAAIDLRELPRVRAGLAALPCVLAADVVSGDRGIMIHLIARSTGDLVTVLRRDIAPLGLQDADIRLIVRPLVRARTPDLTNLVGPNVSLRVAFPERAPTDEAGLLHALRPVA